MSVQSDCNVRAGILYVGVVLAKTKSECHRWIAANTSLPQGKELERKQVEICPLMWLCFQLRRLQN